MKKKFPYPRVGTETVQPLIGAMEIGMILSIVSDEHIEAGYQHALMRKKVGEADGRKVLDDIAVDLCKQLSHLFANFHRSGCRRCRTKFLRHLG